MVRWLWIADRQVCGWNRSWYFLKCHQTKLARPDGSSQSTGKLAKSSLCLMKHHAIKVYSIAKWLYSNLCSRWRWVVSFMLWGKTVPTGQEGGCVGPRTGLDAVERRKIAAPARNWTLIPQLPNMEPIVTITVFWDMQLCSLAEVYRRFGGMCCLRLHGEKILPWRLGRHVYVKLLADHTASHPRN
jgi:hypothetical protein